MALQALFCKTAGKCLTECYIDTFMNSLRTMDGGLNTQGMRLKMPKATDNDVTKSLRIPPDLYSEILSNMRARGLEPKRDFSAWARMAFTTEIKKETQVREQPGKYGEKP